MVKYLSKFINWYYTYGSTYSRNGLNVPYVQYKMFTLIKLQENVRKPSNFLRGCLRQYSNCIQEKNSQKRSRAPVEGVRHEATRVQFCSSLLPYFLPN